MQAAFVKLIRLSRILHALKVGIYLTHSIVTWLLSVTTQRSHDPLARCTLKLGLTEQSGSLIFRDAGGEPPCMSPIGDLPGVTLPLHPFHSHVPIPAPVLPGVSCQKGPRHRKIFSLSDLPLNADFYFFCSENESKARMANAGDFSLHVGTHLRYF